MEKNGGDLNPMDLLNMSPKDLMVKTCNGNPGALTVLANIYKKFGAEINPLCIAMIMTKSQGCALWIVYKDLCNYDTEKTNILLRDWYNNSTASLNDWLVASHNVDESNFEKR